MGQENSNEKRRLKTTPIRQWWSELSWFEPHPTKGWRDHLWLTLAAAVIFLPLLGTFGLWDPWETHYGEVARQITERQDWISLWWGSHWEGGGGNTEGGYFFSKPVLLMWMMALGIEVIGVNEWAIRLGVALTAMLAVVVVYSFGASVFRRRTGVLMATVLATSPFWAMLGRQSQTDMPFVGTMTVGMCFFMMAVFGKDRDARAGRFSQLLCLAWIAVLAIPQLSLVLMGLSSWRGPEVGLMADLTANPMMLTGIWGGVLGVAALLAAWTLVWRHRVRRKIALVALGIVWLPLLGLLLGLLLTSGEVRVDELLVGWFIWGPVQASIYATCFGLALYLVFDRPTMTRRRLYLLTFYVFIALATLAKGLLGFMLPGAILFLYILINREWGLLRRVELLRGTLIFIAVAFPWYAAMLIRHHPGFWNRFFVHDHFQRFSSGVHALSSGSFEHFIRWLGYGLFPWSAFLPAALVRIFSRGKQPFAGDQGRAILMLLIWAVVAFTLFSLSSTTFHHYILPAVPALAMLVGIAVDDLLESTEGQPWPLYALGAAIVAVVMWDLFSDPQQIKNLFTYRYDRNWDHQAWDGGFQVALAIISVLMVAGAALVPIVRNRATRRWSVSILCAGALAMVLFCLNVYMPAISGTMSQKSIWDRYYELCDPIEPPPGADRRKTYCEQPAIAFKLNWRGETYYTANEVRPVRSDEDWDVFLEEVGDGTFYAIMQHARFRGDFQRSLPERFRGQTCLVHDSNLKFVLAKTPCADDDPARVDGQDGEESE